MNKQELADKVKEFGDAIITYRSPESKKLKYNVCTLNLDTPYVKTKQNRAKETDDTLLLFCWDVDAYRLLKPENVTRVEPLAGALKEGSNVG